MICIIQTLIIIVLVILLVLPKEDKLKYKDNPKESKQEEKTKDYVGIYHTDNYNKTYSDVNFIINSDNTCSFTIYQDNLVNCTYKEEGQDKLILTFTGYAIGNKDDKVIDRVVLSKGNTKEACLEVLNRAKENTPTWYEGIDDCQKVTEDIELTFINGGVMYNNKPFYKIK